MINLKKLVSILTILATICAAAEEAKENGGGGFTVELIHRDSPAASPLYNPLLSRRQRMSIAFHNSMNRAAAAADSSAASVRVLPDPKGTYLIRLSVGAPTPAAKLAVADTGSDLIWLQCCHPPVHDQKAPVFNPNDSLTYKPVPCDSKACSGLPRSRCAAAASGGGGGGGGSNTTCLYSATYNDGSFSYGELATDTFTLDVVSGGKNASFPDIIFGCGFKNYFENNDTEVSGIVGLGSSPYSLINQIGGARFSYCLVPLSNLNASSTLHLGHRSAVVHGGPGVVSTPLILKPPRNFYYLTLLGISVGNQTLNLVDESSSRAVPKGNIFIDSGTTFSFLPADLYLRLEEMVRNSISLKPMEPNPRRFLRLCYRDLGAEDVPIITARFDGGGELKLKAVNSFVDIGDGVGCLGFAPTKGIPVFGNVAHTNFLVEYDLEKMVVSFEATDCVKWKYK
ncbi:PREDICTED: aspartic proteinase CDR1-like [Ipomoea nil]|uniref:aspartic proteinase CDR1-like n=1 Tax=Ipomoea nil TaxID=35883 RepID=UPI0009017997|nr:PREDICTED: aspartic proteinase CDR1-like [Ipomoea nil]